MTHKVEHFVKKGVATCSHIVWPFSEEETQKMLNYSGKTIESLQDEWFHEKAQSISKSLKKATKSGLSFPEYMRQINEEIMEILSEIL